MTSKFNSIWLVGILILVCGFSMSAAGAITAEQVAQKAAAVINSSKGLSATFTVSANGKTSKGTVKNSGTKFAVSMPEVSTWYDGKSLYTYNPRTQETTVTIPDAQELAESNPLLYVKGGGAGFIYKFSTVKRQGKYIIDLVPRNNKSGIKKITFTINSANFHIEKINVSSASGSTAVTVTSFRTGVTIPAGEFIYPKSKYPKAEIVDLR